MHKRLLAAMGAAAVPIAGLVTMAPGTALADGTAPVTVVRATTPLTSSDTLNGLTFYHQVSGTDENPETGSVALVDGPGTPPLGAGSLRLSTGSNGDTGVALFDQSYLNYYFDTDFDPVIPFPVTYQPAALFLKFGYLDTASDLPTEVMITVWRGSAPINFFADLPTGADWQTFDITTAQLLQDGGDGVTTHTLADWAEPGDSLFSVFVGADYNDTDANPNKSVYIDDLTYGFGVSLGYESPHPPTEFDFEHGGGPSVTAGAGRTITAGHAARLSVHVANGTTAVAGAHMELWGRTAGAKHYKKVATADTGALGNASKKVRPVHTTVYKWRYMGTDAAPEIPGIDSVVRKVRVRDRVSITAIDPNVTTSQRIRIRGTTYPAKAKDTVKVYRVANGHRHKFGTTVTNSKGGFRFAHAPLKHGKYRFFCIVAAQSGNLAGKSRTITIHVD